MGDPWAALRAIMNRVLKVLRDQMWGGVAGIVAVITLLSTLLALPQAAPARAGIAASLGGATPTATIVLPTATPTATETPTVISTATALPAVAETPASLPSSYDSLSPYGTSTIAPNWRWDCGGCDEPVLITVTQVASNASAENMVWTLSLYNHSAGNEDVSIYSFQLKDPNDVSHDASGPASTSRLVAAGQTVQVQETFSFLPRHGASYTLTAGVNLDNPCCFSRNYGPQTITF